MEGAGHWVNHDKLEEFLSVIEEFFEDVSIGEIGEKFFSFYSDNKTMLEKPSGSPDFSSLIYPEMVAE